MNTKQIQAALIARGYDLGPGADDGDAGPLTLAATSAFQRSIGLPGSGIPGPKTLEALSKPLVEVAVVEDFPPWLKVAEDDLNVVEGKGKLNNPRVVKMFADSGFPGIKDDSVAWCAAAVGSWLKRAGIAPSGSLAARSYERWGVGLKNPVLGCVATKRRGNSTWQGHVGLVVGASPTKVFLLGGNQGDKVSVASFNRSEFTSFRWPHDVPVSTLPLPKDIASAKSNVTEA